MNPTVRIATNEEGQKIKAIIEEAGWSINGMEINWSDIYPYWLIAEQDGEVIGCVQVCMSRPVGRIEFLACKKELDDQLRATVIKALCYGACATLKAGGAQLMTGFVLFDNQSFKKVLKKRGCVVIGSGNMLLKRLA